MKQTASRVSLTCDGCGREFQMRETRYRQRLKRNQKKFYCNRDCFAADPVRRADFLTPFRIMISKAKTRHKRRHMSENHDWHMDDFDLTPEALAELWRDQGGRCAITGIGMDININETESHGLDYVSLDRVDQNRGYSMDNVQLVCMFINLGKGMHSDAEVMEILEKIKKN